MTVLKNNPDILKFDEELALVFEVALSTVHRWNSGIVQPHPTIINKILAYIDEIKKMKQTETHEFSCLIYICTCKKKK